MSTAPADSPLDQLPVAPRHAQRMELRGPMQRKNAARYRRARARGECEVWLEVMCPDGAGGWTPHRHRYHMLELEDRYGEATWSRAEIADDGTARVRRDGRWHVWRPSTLGRAPRRRTNTRARGSRRRTRSSSGSGSRGDPDDDDDESSRPVGESAPPNLLRVREAGR